MIRARHLGSELPPHLVHRELANGELKNQRVQDWLNHPLTWIVMAALLGALVGSFAGGFGQRQTKLLLGLTYLFVLFRYPSYLGTGIFLILYAFPTAIWIGDTNFIFVTFITVAWLVRMSLGLEHRPRRTYLDWAIFAYVAAHLISLTQVPGPFAFTKSLFALRHLFVPIAFYYALVNVGRSERKLLFLARMFTVSAAVLYFTAFMERYAPGVAFLPRWYLSALGARDLFMMDVSHQRIGGVLTHALMGDLAAVSVIVQMYLAIRARGRIAWRAIHWLLAATSVFVISLTGNRGALIALVAGLLLFLWVFRREVTWRRTVVGLVGLFGILMIAEQALSRFEGNVTLLSRTIGTYIDRGIPDTRRQAWSYVWQRIAERPWLGHGPYYEVGRTISGQRAWPHNAFLFYFFSIGLVGLPTFLVLVGRVLKRTWAGHGLDVGRISLAQGMTAVMNIAIVQFLVGQLRTDHQRANVYVFFMWVLFGLGILAREVWEDQRRSRPARAPYNA
jgi:O-antigen ligase